MTLPHIIRLVVRNFQAALDPLTMLVIFGQPAFLVIVLGTMFGQLIGSVGASGSYVAFFVPGMIATTMITGAVLAARILWLDRRFSMVEQLLSGPYERLDYIGALLLTTLLFSLVGVAILVLVALPLLGLHSLTAEGLLVVLGTVALGATFFGGALISLAARTRSSTLFFTVQSLLQFFVIYVSTVYYPVTGRTPAPLRLAIDVNPLTYAAQIIRDAFLLRLDTGDLFAGLVLGVLAGLSFASALFFFGSNQVRSDRLTHEGAAPSVHHWGARLKG
ncbi:ABC-type multidrug transport system, permease component, partial [mine drainage metagenome]